MLPSSKCNVEHGACRVADMVMAAIISLWHNSGSSLDDILEWIQVSPHACPSALCDNVHEAFNSSTVPYPAQHCESLQQIGTRFARLLEVLLKLPPEPLACIAFLCYGASVMSVDGLMG